MNIGIFTDTYYPEINGVANSAFQLKKELENKGHNVYAFTVSNPEADKDEKNVFRMKSKAFFLLKERRVCYDLFSRWMPIIDSLQLDLIHTQTEFTVGHIGRRAARFLDIPLIHTYHTIYEDYTHYFKIPGNENLKGAVRSFSRICCDHADEVIVPTGKVKKLLEKYGVKNKIDILPTGIDLNKFAFVSEKEVMELRKSLNLQDENHVLISMGRLSQEKNLYQLIDYVHKVIRQDRNARLVVVGDGPEREGLEAYTVQLGIEDYVRFTGEVKWKQIQNYYALGDVFVCNSSSETQGLTYIEALASGKPILVRKDECLDDYLVQGENGYSYTNAEEFEYYYDALFCCKGYLKMSEAARESAYNMSSAAFGDGMEIIYTDLIEQKNAGTEKGQGLYGIFHPIAG